MFQLRRAIANLWTPAPQNDEGGNGTATPTEHTSPQAPRSLVGEACDPEEEESSRADHKRGEEESSAPGMQHGSLPPPIREIRLSYPWGTRDPHPPAGWSTAAHEDPSRTRSLHFQRRASLPPSPLSASVSDIDRHVRVIVPSDENSSSVKRRRDRHIPWPVSGHRSELLEGLRHQDPPSRRRRQCNTNSTYVSPSQPPLPEIGAEAELDLLRSWPPPRLTFRAGLIKRALSGRGAAANRSISRSTVISRRRRRELDDALVQRAYDATHPSAPQGEEDGEDEQSSRSSEDASRVRREKEEKEEAFWRRLRRVEEERDRQIEEELASRWKNLQRLRAEADAEIADALASKHVLNGIKEAQAAGEWSKLEKLLATAEESGLKTQLEFVSARQALRSAKDRATKVAEEQAAKAAEEEAAKAAEEEAAKAAEEEAAKAAEEEAAKAAEEEAAKAAEEEAAKNDRAAAAAETKAPAPATAPTARGMLVGHPSEAVEQKTVQRASAPTFLQRAEELKEAVEARRALNDSLMASADPAIKRMRMAFKKAYQGSLNKLACSPSSVSLVMREIHEKANAPLTEARIGGYIDRAQEFFLYNVADKLVVYAERDHFSAESYRMAFPLACVAVDLMTEHRHLAELFLGRLFAGCPSAVPALAFNTAGMSDTKVMSLLGKLEGEDMTAYLNRTKGLIVLMAATMQTPSRRLGELPHPLPLAEGWRWITRFLNGLTAYVRRGNSPPVPTGPVLEWFLKVAGFELQRRYGKAFQKVVLIIKTDVLPILLPRSMVPHLLDVIIQDYESTGCRFLPPAFRETEFRDFRAWGET